MIPVIVQKIDVLYDRDLITYYDRLLIFPRTKMYFIINYILFILYKPIIQIIKHTESAIFLIRILNPTAC